MLHLTPGLTAYLLFLTLVLGLCMGSFLNCMAWRLCHGESVWKGRSHCAKCGHPLSALDLVPLLSYIFLKGRCRYCGDQISPRYPTTELICGLVFLSVVLCHDFTLDTARYLILCCILLVAALTDLESMEIPDRLHVAGILLWAAFIPLAPEPGQYVRNGVLGGFGVGGALLLIVLAADKVLGRESMGGGDIKLLFVTGLHLGWAGNLLLLIYACVLGLLFAAAAKGRDRKFPFAPAIAGATWLYLLTGQPIVTWYLGLF